MPKDPAGPEAAGATTRPKLKVEYVALDKLKPYPNNPRVHTDDQVAKIAESIRAFGWSAPILVDGDLGIIAGHGRALAAARLEMKTVPVVRLAHLSENERRALIIADNQLTLAGEWDMPLLRAEINTLKMSGFGQLELLGFDNAKLVAFMANPTPPDQFEEFTPENVETDYCCPRCQYRWSGNPAPAAEDHAPTAGAKK